jgi:hypothetical protein
MSLPVTGGGGAGAAAPTPATTLPGSPTGNQQAILTDSLVSPTYSWLLQWNAATSQWIFLGGADWIGAIDTDQTSNGAGVFVDLATVGPSFTTPRAGTYQIAWSAETYINAAATNHIGVNVNGVLPVISTNTALTIQHVATGVHGVGACSPRSFSGIGAGQVIKLQYHDGGGLSDFLIRRLSIRPQFLT